MTNEELIATIRNKIEGQFSVFLNLLNASQEYGYHKALEFVLSVLSDLEKSMPKVTDGDGQEEENVPKGQEEAARHYLLNEHSSPLNAVFHQADLKSEMVYHKDIENAFIAGAKWQKEQSLIESHKAWMDHKSSMIKQIEKAEWQGYDRGLADGTVLGKEQMMKDAVEGVITNAGGVFGYDVAVFRLDDNHTYSVLLSHEEKRKYGDKVRIIIVKEDEK